MAYDVLIRNGRVYDGTGFPSYQADIAIQGDRIAEIGRIKASAGRVIDADGLAVAPGFIDHHTHYDAQLLWDPLAASSCWHGVTTVITGNCSLSLAPCKPADRDGLVGSFVRVEAISRRVLEAGVDWSWQSFGEYLKRLERERGMNVAAMVGHTAIRQNAMGEAAVERPANEDEIKAMRAALREAMAGGAIGLSCNQSKHHFREDGRPIPACVAKPDELVELAAELGDFNAGMIQMNGGSLGSETPIDEAFELYRRLAEAAGRPVLYSQILQRPGNDIWRDAIGRTYDLLASGHRVYGVSNSLPLTQQFTLGNVQSALQRLPAWRDLLFSDKATRMAAFADPDRRPALREGATDIVSRYRLKSTKQPAYQTYIGKTVAQIAAATNQHPVDLVLDLSVAEELNTAFENIVANGDPVTLAEMLRERAMLIGVSDAGAHTVFAADFGYCTELVGPWVRERNLMSLEEAVSRLTLYPASIFGLHDRGQVRPGFAADLVLFDPATVRPGQTQLVHDYPAGEGRLAQSAHGIHATLINGQVFTEEGRHTGALPGRVLRNERASSH